MDVQRLKKDLAIVFSYFDTSALMSIKMQIMFEKWDKMR